MTSTKTTMTNGTPLALAFAALFGLSGSAVAQGMPEPGSAAAPGMEAPASAAVDDAKFDDFVEAFVAVQEINDELSGQLMEAPDPERAHELQQQAQQEMVVAIEEQGISVEQYNEIVMALRHDQGLNERLHQSLSTRQ
ncbi:DUF4168 domain-containing protein [Thioalkalicoccus limnaeus]|uniref:DUF4168 domain-containing protein n=1 Tax=Thioalkalicoccus limnaeus TaxID=120681 RepID=A0ABV4BEL1_9GAMM